MIHTLDTIMSEYYQHVDVYKKCSMMWKILSIH